MNSLILVVYELILVIHEFISVWSTGNCDWQKNSDCRL